MRNLLLSVAATTLALGLVVGGYSAGSGRVAGIYIATGPASSPYNRILRIDPATGDRSYVSWETPTQGPVFGYFSGICVENSSTLLVRADAFNLYRVNRQTGYRDIVSSSSSGFFQFSEHGDVELRTSSTLLASYSDGSLGSVTLSNGARSVVSGPTRGTGPQMWARDYCLEPDGTITVMDENGVLFRVDPATGNRTQLLDTGVLLSKYVVRLSGGDYVTATRFGITRCTMPSGPIQSLPGPTFNNLWGMAGGPDDTLYVFAITEQTVYAVNPVNGTRTIVSSSNPATPVGTGAPIPASLNNGALALDIVGLPPSAGAQDWQLLE
jgi:hypothetical protein